MAGQPVALPAPGSRNCGRAAPGHQGDATPCSCTAVGVSPVSPDSPGMGWAGGGGTEHPQPHLVLHPYPEPLREISHGILGDVPHPSSRAAPPAPGHQGWSLQGTKCLFLSLAILQTPWLPRLCTSGGRQQPLEEPSGPETCSTPEQGGNPRSILHGRGHGARPGLNTEKGKKKPPRQRFPRVWATPWHFWELKAKAKARWFLTRRTWPRRSPAPGGSQATSLTSSERTDPLLAIFKGLSQGGRADGTALSCQVQRDLSFLKQMLL